MTVQNAPKTVCFAWKAYWKKRRHVLKKKGLRSVKFHSDHKPMEERIKEILAAMNTTELVVENKTWK